MTQIEIYNLTRIFKAQRGLQPTSFAVEKGEMIGIVGHNGAGKSTLLKLLAHCILPDNGQVFIDDINIRNRLAVVGKIGFVPETPNLYDQFSVEYNLALYARLFDVPVSRSEEILAEFELLTFRKDKIEMLSKGLRQRVSIGRALLADPPLLLFDEPTAALDYTMTQDIYRLLQRFHSAGKTIIFTSHQPHEIHLLATRLIVLSNGTVIFDGIPADYTRAPVHNRTGQA